MEASAYVDLQLRLASTALSIQSGTIVPDLGKISEELDAAASELSPSAILQKRLGLSDMAMRVVWTLTATMLDGAFRARVAEHVGSNRITADAIARVVYEGSPRLAFFELGPTSPLRQLDVIERSDGGSPDLHDTQWGWTISRRIVA